MKVSFEGIESSSARFLARLREKRLLTEDEHGVPRPTKLSQLEVSFEGMAPTDWLNLVDVATLALIIRAHAEAGCQVTVTYPRKTRGGFSRIYVYLEDLEFHDLFSAADRQPWQRNISFNHYDPEWVGLRTGAHPTHFIPLRWFNKGDFSFDPRMTIWGTEHSLSEDVERRFRSLLQRKEYADTDTIDLLCRTMFMELGWNVVLHSSNNPGTGLGIIGAEVVGDSTASARPPVLTFCIADIGRGIHQTLRSAYENDRDRGKKLLPTYATIPEHDVLRYSLFNDTSSRPEYPSSWAKDSLRGLARVTHALEGHGDLFIRSGPAAIRLKGRVDATDELEIGDYRQHPTWGTQVVGTLEQSGEAKRRLLPMGNGWHLPDFEVKLLTDSLGHCLQLRTEAATRELAGQFRFSSKIVVLDLGFGEEGPRGLEYLAKSLLSDHQETWFIFWNVRSQWNELASLDRWVRDLQLVGLKHPPLLVRTFRDMRLLGISDPPREMHNPTVELWGKLIDGTQSRPAGVGIEVGMGLDAYIHLMRAANAAYLHHGFHCIRAAGDATNGHAGFYIGCIHLLKGGDDENRYFSLARNIERSSLGQFFRWVNSCAAGITAILEKQPVPDERLVIIAFTGTVRDVIVDTLYRLERRCRAHVLLTFDVPNQHEISPLVAAGDRVILVTDVISSGSLVESVIELIHRVHAEVLGVVGLVQRRITERVSETHITSAKLQIPLLACGLLPTLETAKDAESAEFWVDPVSLVPSPSRPIGWSQGYDEKIERTLEFVRDTNAAICGHLVDGARHTSVYIDLARALQTGGAWLRRQAFEVFRDRLKSRGWDFQPKVILFPAGIARIETLTRGSRPPRQSIIHAYATAVPAYVSAIRSLWESLEYPIREIEVARAFDPGGGSRCARTADWPTDLPAEFDAVVADDGIWRGTTANSLIRLAVARGARRVLVVPILARITPNEASHLESLQSIEYDGRVVEVCYAFPLLLPIPYYGAHECPYEATIHQLNAKLIRYPAIAKVSRRLIESLQGKSPAVKGRGEATHAEMWVRTRVFAELATLNEVYLERLGNLVKECADPLALEAMMQLFVEEWQLLGRARLRQTVSPIVRKRAQDLAIDSSVPSGLRVAAITLLRSLYRRHFITLLPALVDNALQHPEELARILYQVATLDPQYRNAPECMQFLEAVSERGTTMQPGGDSLAPVQEFSELIADCRSLYIESRAVRPASVPTNRQAAHLLLDGLINSGYAENHHMRAFFMILTTRPPRFDELDHAVLRSYSEPWVNTFAPRLQDKIFPWVQQISALLLSTGNPDHGIYRTDLFFLKDHCQRLRDAIAGFETWLKFLIDAEQKRELKSMVGQLYWDNLLANARRINDDLIAENSKTVTLLKEMKRLSVAEFISRFTKQTTIQFAGARRPLVIDPPQGLETLQPSAMIFAPASLVDECIDNVIHNLLRYAYPAQRSGRARLGIIVSDAGQNEEPAVEIQIKNDGEPLRPGAQSGQGGSRINAGLEVFGGKYYAPVMADDPSWTVAQRILFTLW